MSEWLVHDAHRHVGVLAAYAFYGGRLDRRSALDRRHML
jgi:hypothetical protein